MFDVLATTTPDRVGAERLLEFQRFVCSLILSPSRTIGH